jgi:serine/threonine-protein kinase
MVYEMIAGEAPFQGRTTLSVISRQLSDMASPMRVLRGTVPAGLDKVVGKALSKSPSDRYGSIVDFAAAVIQAINPGAVIRFHTPAGFTPRPFPALDGVFGGKRRLLLVGAGLAVVMTVGALSVLWRSDPIPSNGKPVRIAVRSVANLTGSTANEGAVDLLTADLIDHLHHLDGLEVRDRSSSVALRESALTTPQFADSLDVSHVIGSDLELGDEGFVLKAYLADSTGKILQSSRSQLARDFGTGMRDSVLRSLIRELAAGLPHVIAVTSDGHEHLIGHDQVLNGSRQLATRTVRGLRGALTDFDAAIAMEPAYAEAYAELSKAYSLALAYRYRLPIGPYDAAGRALVAADRAIALESDLASGYSARGYIQRLTMTPPLAIVASFDTAKMIDPDAADAVGWSAPALVLQSRFDDALAAAQRAIRLDKLSASRRITLAVVSTSVHRYDDAVRSAAAARALAPELGLAKAWWARALILGGRAAECADEDLTPHAGLRALCLREAGRTAEAKAIVDSLRRRHVAGTMADSTFTDVPLLEDLATYFASAGDATRATEWMERAYERAPNGITPEVLDSELFTPVRSNAMFSQALARSRVRVAERLAVAREAARRQMAGPVAPHVTALASRTR